MAKSITCLESTHSTVSDVYVFWLACMAGVYEAITTETHGMTQSDKDTIREAAQARWLQMIDRAPCDIYFAGFMLDPRFRDHDLLDDLNPFSIKTIKIPSQNPNQSEKLPKSVICLGDFLLSLLRIEYEKKDAPIADLPVARALDNLKDQICAYVKGSYPFEQPLSPSQDPFEWWKHLDADVSRKAVAQPLAHLARRIFALTPNSMADERTQSTYTWLNSYLRNRQNVPTVTRMIQIRQWCLQERKKTTVTRRPTVKFRDMNTILRMPQTASTDSEGGSKGESGPKDPTVILDDTEHDEGIDDLLDSESECEEGVDQEGSGDEEDSDPNYLYPGDLDNVAEGVNLESWMLKDYLSDVAVARPDPGTKRKGKGRGKAATDGVATRTLEESDWKMNSN